MSEIPSEIAAQQEAKYVLRFDHYEKNFRLYAKDIAPFSCEPVKIDSVRKELRATDLTLVVRNQKRSYL